MYRSLTALAATGVLLAAAPAADAAVTRTFDFRTGTSTTEGHAHAWGLWHSRPPGEPHRPAQRRLPW